MRRSEVSKVLNMKFPGVAIAFLAMLWVALPCLSTIVLDDTTCGKANGYDIEPWMAVIVKTDSDETSPAIGTLIDSSHVFVYDSFQKFLGTTEENWHVLLNNKAKKVNVATIEKYPCGGGSARQRHYVLTLEEEVLDIPAVCIRSTRRGESFIPADTTFTSRKNNMELAKFTPATFKDHGAVNLKSSMESYEFVFSEGNVPDGSGQPATVIESAQSTLIGFSYQVITSYATPGAPLTSTVYLLRIDPKMFKWIQEKDFDCPNVEYDCSAN